MASYFDEHDTNSGDAQTENDALALARYFIDYFSKILLNLLTYTNKINTSLQYANIQKSLIVILCRLTYRK